MGKQQENQEEPKDMKKEILSWIAYLAFVVTLTFFIVTFIGQRTKVDGRSMENNFHDGDNLIVDKLTYRFSDPKRFDVVVFPPQGAPKEHYIKRIIGLPGETVQIDMDGTIYIDGEILEENYGAEKILDPGRAINPITLADDEYFVLGDNRNHSLDSRWDKVGNLKRNTLTGKAWVRIWPLSDFGFIK